jgi:hypothetical protein
MNALVCLTLADAQKYQSDVDAKIGGYPHDGVDVGGGVHATAAEGRTYHYAGVLKHPTLSIAAYLDNTAVGDDVSTGKAAVAKPVGSSVQTLDATWTPVIP